MKNIPHFQATNKTIYYRNGKLRVHCYPIDYVLLDGKWMKEVEFDTKYEAISPGFARYLAHWAARTPDSRIPRY